MVYLGVRVDGSKHHTITYFFNKITGHVAGFTGQRVAHELQEIATPVCFATRQEPTFGRLRSARACGRSGSQ